jgi:transcriptional regulator with XRE-family HTH domain
MLPFISSSQPLSTARPFRRAIGEALRAARRVRGLTLRDVGRLSQGRFKPSALGGYERGERAIAMDRFSELAELYGIPADRLLGQVLDRVAPEGRTEVVVDLNQLALLPGDEPRLAAELVDRVRSQRGEQAREVVTLRSGDLEAIALAARLTPADLLRRLDPALHIRDSGRPGDNSS